MMRHYRWATKAVVGMAAIALALGCARGAAKVERFGSAVPEGGSTVKLADVLERPDAYDGQAVVLEGTYAGHCCATDFNYKEGTDAVECYYPGFEVPERKAGRPVRIHATVRVKGGGEAGKSAEEPSEDKAGAGEAHVALDAKGVEFR